MMRAFTFDDSPVLVFLPFDFLTRRVEDCLTLMI